MTHPTEPESSPTVTVRVVTPDGVMFVHIMEYANGLPYKLDLSIGKAGSSVQAWAQALSRVISLALVMGVPITSIAECVSAITTDRLSFNGNRAVRSSPDGIAQAIIQYVADKSPVFRKRVKRRGPTVFGEGVDD
jgi:hypothetical protein